MEAFAVVLGLASKVVPGAKQDDLFQVIKDEGKVPMKILDAIEKHIDAEPNPSHDTLKAWVTALTDLLEEYAMTDGHRMQIVNIKKVITARDRSLGDSINIGRFSRCALYPGKIAFWR